MAPELREQLQAHRGSAYTIERVPRSSAPQRVGPVPNHDGLVGVRPPRDCAPHSARHAEDRCRDNRRPSPRAQAARSPPPTTIKRSVSAVSGLMSGAADAQRVAVVGSPGGGVAAPSDLY
jgi:hypothetical protein